MTEFRNLIIAPLNPTHDRTDFQCGVETLDRYLKKQAKGFYEQFGFARLSDDSLRLFLPLKSI